MSKKIVASRISSGNKIFPPSVILEENGMTVKFPGFFKSQANYLAYSDLSGFAVNSPLVGYSTISFMLKGDKITAHGFTKNDAEIIRKKIDANIKNKTNKEK